MKEAGACRPGGMAAALGLDAEEVAAICARVSAETGGYVGVANDNCPGQVVISGDEAALVAGMEAMQAAGARRVVRLAVSIAAHSPLMAEAAAAFRHALEKGPLRRLPCSLHRQRHRRRAGGAGVHPGGPGPPADLSGPLAGLRAGDDPPSAARLWKWAGDVLTGLLRRIDASVHGLTVAQLLGLA